MSGTAGTRVGVGTRFLYDGQAFEVVELAATTAGNEVVLSDAHGRIQRLTLKELLFSDRARVIPDGPGPSGTDAEDIASVILDQLSHDERVLAIERAGHVREVLTGFRSGSSELAVGGEPREPYGLSVPMESRKAAKAAELGVTVRTVERWLADFRRHGEAGLAPRRKRSGALRPAADQRWVETALEVMVEHTGESKPSRTLVIERTRARVIARFGPEVVRQPSRATAFRILAGLEARHPRFRLSTQRNRDIAARREGPNGKLRPTRPGEYVLMDTTRLDVFAFDPQTLRWVQAELTVAMDWYTLCITGLRLTPVSTKAVAVSAVLFQCAGLAAGRDGCPGLCGAAETAQALRWPVRRTGKGVGARACRARLGGPAVDRGADQSGDRSTNHRQPARCS
ncbi:helix-turn-helix domain-containing protein [Streptomyces sp. NPDC050704]|uniref:helix-turn-helix domain-containing protein n=1 Tax=Streptomyces sp. NPDC050704 TaxID=3157219 RepID=UPI00342C8766